MKITLIQPPSTLSDAALKTLLESLDPNNKLNFKTYTLSHNLLGTGPYTESTIDVASRLTSDEEAALGLLFAKRIQPKHGTLLSLEATNGDMYHCADQLISIDLSFAISTIEPKQQVRVHPEQTKRLIQAHIAEVASTVSREVGIALSALPYQIFSSSRHVYILVINTLVTEPKCALALIQALIENNNPDALTVTSSFPEQPLKRIHTAAADASASQAAESAETTKADHVMGEPTDPVAKTTARLAQLSLTEADQPPTLSLSSLNAASTPLSLSGLFGGSRHTSAPQQTAPAPLTLSGVEPQSSFSLTQQTSRLSLT